MARSFIKNLLEDRMEAFFNFIKSAYFEIERTIAKMFGYQQIRIKFTIYPISRSSNRVFDGYISIKNANKLRHLVNKDPITSSQFEKLTGRYFGGNYVKVFSVTDI